MNRTGLRQLARIRLKEAHTLLHAGCFDGAYFLCGYAVECGLKACIAKTTRRSEFPDLKRVKDNSTHNLRDLVKLAGLEPALRAEVASDPVFERHWAVATQWSEQARYARSAPLDARNLYAAATDRQHGVVRWIKRHW